MRRFLSGHAAWVAIGVLGAAAAAVVPATAASAAVAATSATAPAPGSVYAFGDDTNGLLGDGGTGSMVTTPVQVKFPVGTDVVDIAAGADFALARTRAGQVYEWGRAIGTPSGYQAPTLVSFPSGTDITAIAAGGDHALAQSVDGSLFAWGSNSHGQVGDGTTTDRPDPVSIALPGALAGRPLFLAAGTAFSVVAPTGQQNHDLAAWGEDDNGELGDGSTTQELTPELLPLNYDFVLGLAAHGDFTELTSAIGTLVWGANGDGELGDGSTATRSTPESIVTAASQAGTFHQAVGTGDQACYTAPGVNGGAAQAWGDNTTGALGNGTTTSSTTPVTISVPSGDALVSIAGGDGDALAVTNAGTALSWGQNNHGQLGSGTILSSSTPAAVIGLPAHQGVEAVAAEESSSFVLTAPVALAVTVTPVPVDHGGDAIFSTGSGQLGVSAALPNGAELPDSGTLHVSSTDSAAKLPADQQFSGSSTLGLTFGNTGIQTVTVTLTRLDGSTISTTSTPYTVDGPPDGISVGFYDSSSSTGDVTSTTVATAGDAVFITAMLVNAQGDALGAFSPFPGEGKGTFSSFSSPQGECGINGNYVCVFQSVTPPGSVATVYVTAGGFSNSLSFPVVAGPLNHITLATGPVAKNRQPISVTVNGFDAFGNSTGGANGVATLRIAPNGTCTTTTCTPATSGPHTVTATVPTPSQASPTATASISVVPGQSAPTVSSLTLHAAGRSISVAYRADGQGTSPVKVSLVGVSKGHHTVIAKRTGTAGTLTLNNLVTGATYALTFTVSTPSGGSSTLGLPKTRVAVVPVISLRANTTTPFIHQRVTFTGIITTGGKPFAEHVLLLRRRVGTHTVTVARFRSDRHGRFSVTAVVGSTATYSVETVYGPIRASATATSPGVHISAR